jgi:hypothetical protein
MTGQTIAMLALLALALVLPVAALRDRRIDWGRGWKMAAIWVAVFILVAMAFAWLGM